MGIYRLLDVLARHDPMVNINQITAGHKRIVICYPPYNYHMDPSDMVRKILFTIPTNDFSFLQVYVMQQTRPYTSQYSRENSMPLSQTR